MTKQQAVLLSESLELEWLFSDEEEVEQLRIQNPELLDAYKALLALATGEDSCCRD